MQKERGRIAKEYGKLSSDQFRQLIDKLPEMRESMRKLPGLLRSASSKEVKVVLDGGIYWAAFRELPFAQHVALGLHFLRQKERLKEISQAVDPQDEFRRLIEREDVSEPAGRTHTQRPLGNTRLSW